MIQSPKGQLVRGEMPDTKTHENILEKESQDVVTKH